MKVSLLTNRQATHAVLQLLQRCNQFDVAVAWAGENAVVDAMLAARKKLRHVVIGTHMYQTDPKALRSFMPIRGARCLPPSGHLFHPKVYLFETPEGLSAIVGSHNLTRSAFAGKNIEVSVLIEGSTDDKVLDGLMSFVKTAWKSAEAIDEDNFLFAYECQFKLNKEKKKALEQFHKLTKPRGGGSKPSPLLLTWSDFVSAVKADINFSLEDRLAILERAALLFSENSSFAKMQRDERRAIAGTYGSKEPKLDDLHWSWFGTMSGQGDFTNLVSESPSRLSTALAHIPLEGDVSQAQYDAFVKGFNFAFKGKAHRGGVATASRLLAMKRPDVFVAVNDANRVGICRAFETARTMLSLDNYWERIVVPTQLSPVWQQARPRGSLNGRIWDNRAALLDSIYYDPKAKAKAKKKPKP